MKNNKSRSYDAPAVQKAFQLLKIVAESRKEVGLSDLARQMELSKGTTYGLTKALLKVGALDRNPQSKKFFLGPAIVELAFRSWNYLRLSELAQPILDELRDRVGETVFLGIMSRRSGIIVAISEASKPLKISSPPGSSIPLLAGAVGKVFLAQLDKEMAKKIIKEIGLPSYTDNSIIDEELYIEELARVRRKGYAIDNEEYLPGVKAVAVALGNKRGLPLAIWVVGFTSSMQEDKLSYIIDATKFTARKLRHILDNERD